MKELCKDPFRLFFPVAILCLLYASGIWIRFGVFNQGDFPVEAHANLFLGGFLFLTIMGFLLTAIPRFTQTDFLSKGELGMGVIVLLAVVSTYLFEATPWFWLSIFIGWLILLTFAARRFFKRAQNPPFTFVFVGLGVALGLLGSLFSFLANIHYDTFAHLENWGKLFFYDAMVMAFIIGIGGRLIPGILGFVEIVKEQREVYEKPVPFLKVIPIDIKICLVVFILSLIFEGIGLDRIGYVLRALVITFFSFRYWRLHERVETGKWHGRILKLSCWMLLLPSWLLCFFVADAIHVKHLIYIGSYCLMTLMVASRVVMAHGSEGLEIEFRKLPYLLIGFLVVFAGFTRATAIMMPDSYENHLGYAGILLFVAGVVWVVFFFKRLLIFSK